MLWLVLIVGLAVILNELAGKKETPPGREDRLSPGPRRVPRGAPPPEPLPPMSFQSAAVLFHMAEGRIEKTAAVGNLEAMAQSGNPDAMFFLATDAYGIVGREAALEWLRRASALGHVAARTELALANLDEMDLEASRNELLPLIEAGNTILLLRLADIEWRAGNQDRSRDLLERGARMGIQQACTSLAAKAPDSVTAYFWFNLACDRDSLQRLIQTMSPSEIAAAQARTREWFRTWRSAPNPDHAPDSIEAAALQGDAKAQAMLGQRYSFGEGGSIRDAIEGLKWLLLAAAETPPSGPIHRVVRLARDRMLPGEIAQAEAAIEEFRAGRNSPWYLR